MLIGDVTGPRSFLVNGQRVAGAVSPRGMAIAFYPARQASQPSVGYHRTKPGQRPRGNAAGAALGLVGELEALDDSVLLQTIAWPAAVVESHAPQPVPMPM